MREPRDDLTKIYIVTCLSSRATRAVRPELRRGLRAPWASPGLNNNTCPSDVAPKRVSFPSKPSTRFQDIVGIYT